VIGLFDAGFIYILFDDRARVPRDAKGKPVVDRAQDRIDFLVQTISDRRDKIILPSPALTEFMLLAVDRYRDYLAIIRRKAVFEIAGYDEPEAIEVVEHWLKFGEGKKLKPGTAETWAKLKYDRQIAAIAKTRRVECIYSTDSDLEKYADELNIKFCNLIHLPLPPTEQQRLPFYTEPEQTAPPPPPAETQTAEPSNEKTKPEHKESERKE
jgi:predicted nucleic acid-binding protein